MILSFGVVSVDIAVLYRIIFLRILSITLLTAKLHRERDKLVYSQLTAVTAASLLEHYSQRSGKSNKQSL